LSGHRLTVALASLRRATSFRRSIPNPGSKAKLATGQSATKAV